MSSKVERIIEFDIVKGFAIIGVIIIHLVSSSLSYFPQNSIHFKVLIALDQIFRFSVPLFVAFSGYTLTLSYHAKNPDFLNFLRRRVLRIVPLYFLWSAIIYFYLRILIPEAGSQSFPMWKVILLGKADYHLYFIPMIFQLYFIFPFILKLYKKMGVLLLILAFIFEIAFYTLLTQSAQGTITLPVFKNDQQQYIFSGTWIFFFILGISLSLNKNSLQKFKKKLLIFSSILLLSGLILALVDTLQTIYSKNNLIQATSSTRVAVIIYSTGFILLATIYAQKILTLPKKIIKNLVLFGQRSYITYLCHTLVIRIFIAYIHPNSALAFVALATVTIVTSDYIAYISTYLTNKIYRLIKTKAN